MARKIRIKAPKVKPRLRTPPPPQIHKDAKKYRRARRRRIIEEYLEDF